MHVLLQEVRVDVSETRLVDDALSVSVPLLCLPDLFSHERTSTKLADEDYKGRSRSASCADSFESSKHSTI